MQEKTKKEKAEEELRKWHKEHVGFLSLNDDKEQEKKIYKAMEDSFINRAKKGTL